MNSTPTARLGQLPGLFRIWARSAPSIQQRRHQSTAKEQLPEGHGENIYVFTHRTSQQIIYSFSKTLDGFQDLKQLPFNGKKTKAAKLRKDYWYPMAEIQFPRRSGHVGRSVFQKLRELKHLHEVSWPEELRYKTKEEFTKDDEKKVAAATEKGRVYRPIRSKLERGRALNAQRPNAVADMAAVLAGHGAGNKMQIQPKDGNGSGIVEVIVKWSNDQDREYAEEWSANVRHRLFEDPLYSSYTQTTRGLKPARREPMVKDTTVVETPAAKIPAVETQATESEAPESKTPESEVSEPKVAEPKAKES